MALLREYWISFSIIGPSRLIAPLDSSRPVPFKVDFSPRFPEVIALLASEREIRDH
jgi:hypothetical protein